MQRRAHFKRVNRELVKHLQGHKSNIGNHSAQIDVSMMQDSEGKQISKINERVEHILQKESQRNKSLKRES